MGLELRTPQLPSRLKVLARNIEVLSTKRGWSPAQLAEALQVSPDVLKRIRLAQNRFIDPDVLDRLMKVFNCEPNDLLLPQPGVDYTFSPPY